jgi:hypothetical protein
LVKPERIFSPQIIQVLLIVSLQELSPMLPLLAFPVKT